MDIFAYKTLPRSSDPNALPPQYVMSFNQPLIISNYNFGPLEVYYGKSSIAQLAPKETGQITSIDIKAQSPNLDWRIYDANRLLILQTPNFEVYKRIGLGITTEDFKYSDVSLKVQGSIKMQMEVKKVLH